MAPKDKSMLVSVIGDEDTVTGMLLTGIGERNTKGETNFFIIDSSKSPNNQKTRKRKLKTQLTRRSHQSWP